jgi:uncharacterized repeat protein (TIGR01451 family)
MALTAAGAEDFPASDFRLVSVETRMSGQTSCTTTTECAAVTPLAYSIDDGFVDDPIEAAPFCENQIVDESVGCTLDSDCLPWQECSTGGAGEPPAGACWVDPIAQQQCLSKTVDDSLFTFEENDFDYIITYTYLIIGETGDDACFDVNDCGNGPEELCFNPSVPTATPCTVDSDCGVGGACIGGFCAPSCDANGQCPGGGECLDTACVGRCLTRVTPIQGIASGGQVKHEEIEVPSGEPPGIFGTRNELVLTKSVSSGLGLPLPAIGGTVTYRVTVTNSSGGDVQLDDITDMLPTVPDTGIYEAGSAQVDGVALEPAGDNPFQPSGTNTLVFTGPFTVPGSDSIELTYDVTLPGTPGWYTNRAIGFIGRHQIDETLQLDDDVPAAVSVLVGVNGAPTFTSSPVTSVDEDATYVYNVTTTDPDDGDILAIIPTTLPSWLALVDHGNGTASLTGTPSNAEVGDHNVVLQVTDLDGAFDEQSFTITVVNVEVCGDGNCEGMEPTTCPDDCIDSDNDSWVNSVDNCPEFANPSQGPAVFGHTILATSDDTFSWTDPADAEYVRGDLSAVSSYATNAGGSLVDATTLMDTATPPVGAGFYYLLKPGGSCTVPSWQTIVGTEPGRDTELP